MVKIAKPLISHADQSPAYWQIGNLWQVMCTGVQTDNAFTLLDQVVHLGGGGGPVTHTHTQDEGLYVISGKCTFNAGGHQGLPGSPGTFVAIPGNTEHSFTVDEPDTHVLNFYLPAGFEQLLIGLSRPAPERRPPPPESIEEMMAPPWMAEQLSKDYGEDSVLGNPFVDIPSPEKMLTRPTPGAKLFPFTAKASDLTSYAGVNGTWTVLADGDQTGGCYCLLEVRWSKGTVIPSRVYRERDEMIYVLSGELSLRLNDRVEKAEQGSLVYVPSGTVYSAKVESEHAHCLNLHTKSGFEDFVRLEGQSGSDGVSDVAKRNLFDRIGLVELDVEIL